MVSLKQGGPNIEFGHADCQNLCIRVARALGVSMVESVPNKFTQFAGLVWDQSNSWKLPLSVILRWVILLRFQGCSLGITENNVGQN